MGSQTTDRRSSFTKHKKSRVHKTAVLTDTHPGLAVEMVNLHTRAFGFFECLISPCQIELKSSIELSNELIVANNCQLCQIISNFV